MRPAKSAWLGNRNIVFAAGMDVLPLSNGHKIIMVQAARAQAFPALQSRIGDGFAAFRDGLNFESLDGSIRERSVVQGGRRIPALPRQCGTREVVSNDARTKNLRGAVRCGRLAVNRWRAIYSIEAAVGERAGLLRHDALADA